MIRAEILAYCLAKPGAWQDEPWEDDVVAKVASKIFAFLGPVPHPSIGLKCGAEPGGGRRVAGAGFRTTPRLWPTSAGPGWNTLRIGGAIPDDELLEAIDASYDAVVAKLPKRERPA